MDEPYRVDGRSALVGSGARGPPLHGRILRSPRARRKLAVSRSAGEHQAASTVPVVAPTGGAADPGPSPRGDALAAEADPADAPRGHADDQGVRRDIGGDDA